MLNRRTLRVKAMQSLYSYFQSRQSDYHLALEEISDAFKPDLNSMEVQDPIMLKESKETAVKLFEEKFEDNPITFPSGTEDKVKKAVTGAVVTYRNQLKQDKEHFRRTMLLESEKIYERYLWLMLLIEELAQQEHDEYLRRVNKGSQVQVSTNFYNNRVVKTLREMEEFRTALSQYKITCVEEQETLRSWYMELIREDEAFVAYRQLAEPSQEEDIAWINHLIKQLFFKHESFATFFEERFLNYAEDKSIIKSMLTKTVKGLFSEDDPLAGGLAELSYNWEDDKAFFEDLYVHTLAHDEDFEKRISGKTKNWDIDRVATIDKIMLKMAMAEMIHFTSIPVKVTINEYIEISKLYSTKKSKQFINGVLDVLSEEMKAEGLIKKSGRGLIDNK